MTSTRSPHPPRFEMRGISKRFGQTAALSAVDLAVSPGEVHALIGENGAGKSTLMKVLSGALQPDGGSMLLNSENYAPSAPLSARRQGVAMIYQELSLAPHLTVAENILLGREPTRFGLLDRKAVKEKACEALSLLQHPEVNPDTLVGDLTIATQQLVEIARALAFECKVLVLDEPTSSLTQQDALRLFQLIRRLRDQGIAIVYISHFLEEIQQVSDQYTVLRDGVTVETGNTSEVTISDLVHAMVGRQIVDLFPRKQRKQRDVLLEVNDLSGLPRPIDVSLTLHRGEILGIAGLVGAGRTEFLRVLFGLEPIQSGQIQFARWFGSETPSSRLNHGMGLVSEDRKGEGLATSMSVADNLTLSRMEAFVIPGRQRKIAQEWIEQLDIRTSGPEQSVSSLSGGNQQKVALARLLLHNVDCLLLDEPTRGVDIAGKAEIYRLVNSLANQGKAILLVSSYLPELLGLCDRIAVMHRGRLGPVHSVNQCDEHTLMLEATRGDVQP